MLIKEPCLFGDFYEGIAKTHFTFFLLLLMVLEVVGFFEEMIFS